MKNKNSIVRTKTIHKEYYEIEFMTYKKYILRSKYIFLDTKFILHHYKWYDRRPLFQIPSYWLLLKLRRNNEKISRQKHKVASTITLLVEIFALIELIIRMI